MFLRCKVKPFCWNEEIFPQLFYRKHVTNDGFKASECCCVGSASELYRAVTSL